VLVDRSLPEPVGLYARRAEAERMLAELLRDEPDWESLFLIEEVEFAEPRSA
jgi:hypothetical protein